MNTVHWFTNWSIDWLIR